MKKLVSTSYSAWAFNLAMLLIRLGAGSMIMLIGYNKLINYKAMLNGTYPPMQGRSFQSVIGLGASTELSLLIFAEFFCAIFVMIGLFSRLASIPLIIAMFVALWKAHNFHIYSDGQSPAMFLLFFLTILLCGPGRASVDGMIK